MKACLFLTFLSVAAVASVHGADPTIYDNNFETSSSAGFSSSTISTTPSGTKFLGQFDNTTVNFTQSSLSTYDSLTIGFDLFIINSWDGNGTGFGPDFWSFSINGDTKVNATFDNVGNDQSYPDNSPASHPSRSGAIANNTLGYTFFGDSTYHFNYTIPNSVDVLNLSFKGSNLQGGTDEGWGLDNVKITGTLAAQPNPNQGVPDAGSTFTLLTLGAVGLAALRRARSKT